MAKYSYEFKKKVAMDYINGKGVYKYLSKEYGIPRHKTLEIWVLAYRGYGNERLMRLIEKIFF